MLLTTSLGTGGGGASGSSMSFPVYRKKDERECTISSERAKRGRIQVQLEQQGTCSPRGGNEVEVEVRQDWSNER